MSVPYLLVYQVWLCLGSFQFSTIRSILTNVQIKQTVDIKKMNKILDNQGAPYSYKFADHSYFYSLFQLYKQVIG